MNFLPLCGDMLPHNEGQLIGATPPYCSCRAQCRMLLVDQGGAYRRLSTAETPPFTKMAKSQKSGVALRKRIRSKRATSTKKRSGRAKAMKAHKKSSNRHEGRVNLPLVSAPKEDRAREGNLTVKGEELWLTFGVTSTAPELRQFLPGVSKLARLDLFAQQYDLYRIVSAEVLYKSSAASTTAGRVVVAADYDSLAVPTTLGGLTPMEPQIRPPVWESDSFRIDANRANKQMWLRTSNAAIGVATSAFVLCAANLSATPNVGEVWCRYVVEFTNPRAPATVYSLAYPINATKYMGSRGDEGSPDVAYYQPSGNAEVTLLGPGRFLFFINGWGDTAANILLVLRDIVLPKLKAWAGPDASITGIRTFEVGVQPATIAQFVLNALGAHGVALGMPVPTPPQGSSIPAGAFVLPQIGPALRFANNGFVVFVMRLLAAYGGPDTQNDERENEGATSQRRDEKEIENEELRALQRRIAKLELLSVPALPSSGTDNVPPSDEESEDYIPVPPTRAARSKIH
jgi:hypothetical protein